MELKIDGIGAAIGTKYWNDSAATVVCRMLNISEPCVAPMYYMTSYTSPIWRTWMDSVKCSGNERSLLDCNHPGLRNVREIGSLSATEAVVAVGNLKPASKSDIN